MNLPPPPFIFSRVFPSQHRTAYLAFVVAAITYLNYPLVDPDERVRLVPVDQIQTSYDFIVVGAGSAGSVVSSRLSANPNWTVLLIEAGQDETALTQVPLLEFDDLFTQFTWNRTTVYQPRACQAVGGHCPWVHGRVVGGSSSIGDNYYVRGNRRDFDQWAARGNPGWSYQEVLPYFRLTENMLVPSLREDILYHGSSGPLPLNYAQYQTPLADAYLQAGREMGYFVQDLMAANQTGFMRALCTTVDGSRFSAARAFLRPARNRKNLHVSYNSFVPRILIDPTNKTAYGVQIVRDNQVFMVYSSKEVILSASVTNSPQLLMLSGVGPAQQLSKFGIPVIADLPVGANLQDRPYVLTAFQMNRNATLTEGVYEDPNAVVNFALGEASPLELPLGCEALGFFNVNSSSTSTDYPKIQTSFHSGFADHWVQKGLTFGTVFLLHPQSVGNLTLSSSNPFDPPQINPNYFSVSEDAAVLAEGLELTYKFTQTSAMQAFGMEFYLPSYPNCADLEFPSKEFWACMVYNYADTPMHGVMTCPMGPSDDPASVVDPRLRVHGVGGLRVVDASVIPVIPGANPNAAVLMVGERAAAFIFEDYNATNPAPAA